MLKDRSSNVNNNLLITIGYLIQILEYEGFIKED